MNPGPSKATKNSSRMVRAFAAETFGTGVWPVHIWFRPHTGTTYHPQADPPSHQKGGGSRVGAGEIMKSRNINAPHKNSCCVEQFDICGLGSRPWSCVSQVMVFCFTGSEQHQFVWSVCSTMCLIISPCRLPTPGTPVMSKRKGAMVRRAARSMHLGLAAACGRWW